MSKTLSFSSHQAGRLLLAAGATGLLALAPVEAQGHGEGVPVAPPVEAPIVAAPAEAAPVEAAPAEGAGIQEAPGARPPAAQTEGARLPVKLRISVEYRDADVSDIISSISTAFDIPIIVKQDVEGKLKFFKLKDATPEEAIREVATSADLKFHKRANGTFIIGKHLPEAEAEAARNEALPPVTPWSSGAPGFGAGAITAGPGSVGAPAFSLPGVGNGYTGGYQLPNFLPNGLISGNEKEDAPRVESRYYRVRNVRPGILGWWLDPYNNEKPVELLQTEKSHDKILNSEYYAVPAVNPNQQALQAGGVGGGVNPYINPYANPYVASNSSLFGGGESFGGLPVYGQPGTQTQTNFQFGRRQNTRQTGRQAGGLGGVGGRAAAGVFDLPEGVEQVIAIDPQNALLVRGTAEGLAELENIIAFLDRPLRQVEIEAQFIDVSTDNLKDFGIDFSSNNGPFTTSGTGLAPAPAPDTAGTFKLGYVRNNFQATLTALLRNNRAKIVNAPRVTAINNLSASLFITTGTPVVLTDTIGGIGGQVGQSQNLIFIQTSIGLSVTPTINNDDTITVLMQPQVQLQTPPPPGVQAPGISTQAITTVANVRDGDTIALGGLRTKTITVAERRIPVLSNIPLIGRLFRRSTDIELERELIIFLTARIVRRADDVVPGA